mgnify:FL=1|tara:strand:- start:139 stop:273 length:135 start_codon:yes stop_codon:yes gene_type:complete
MKGCKNLEKLRNALKEAGLDYVITRTDDAIAHVNIWIKEDKDET